MDRRDSSAGRYHHDAITAWILNDDESSRSWMDDELALHRQGQQQQVTATIETSEWDHAALSKTESEGSNYQKKFGKKRRPSLNGGRTKNKHQTINYSSSSLYSNNDDENDDDNNTISTLSTASLLLLDDRDATASSLPPTDEARQERDLRHRHRHHHHEQQQQQQQQQQPPEDDNAGKEIDRVVQGMMYQCHITVVEDLPIETATSPKRAIRNVPSIASETSNTNVAPTTNVITTMLAPPKIRKNRKVSSSSSSKSKTSKRTKKSVTFHKYDKVIYASNQMEYVYSIYKYEVDREKREYDVVDELENAVSDVGYFFRCLQQGISEDVTTTFSRRRKKPKTR